MRQVGVVTNGAVTRIGFCQIVLLVVLLNLVKSWPLSTDLVVLVYRIFCVNVLIFLGCLVFNSCFVFPWTSFWADGDDGAVWHGGWLFSESFLEFFDLLPKETLEVTIEVGEYSAQSAVFLSTLPVFFTFPRILFLALEVCWEVVLLARRAPLVPLRCAVDTEGPVSERVCCAGSEEFVKGLYWTLLLGAPWLRVEMRCESLSLCPGISR